MIGACAGGGVGVAAPSPAAALPVARTEAEFAASLCEGQKVNTLLAVERASGPEGIRERFRVVIEPRRERPHARIWAPVDDGDDA